MFQLIILILIACVVAYFLSEKNYVANVFSKEIHRIKHQQSRCGINRINDKNKLMCRKLFALYLIKYRGYNGCHYCWDEKDNH